MSLAKGFVYAACEDFGIALVEAQACGTPVIAYGVGGAGETVRDIRQWGETGTGILFWEQSEAALVEATEIFEDYRGKFNPEYAQAHAAKFSCQVFAQRYLEFLHKCIEQKALHRR